jgi:hypothetical protein
VAKNVVHLVGNMMVPNFLGPPCDSIVINLPTRSLTVARGKFSGDELDPSTADIETTSVIFEITKSQVVPEAVYALDQLLQREQDAFKVN